MEWLLCASWTYWWLYIQYFFRSDCLTGLNHWPHVQITSLNQNGTILPGSHQAGAATLGKRILVTGAAMWAVKHMARKTRENIEVAQINHQRQETAQATWAPGSLQMKVHQTNWTTQSKSWCMTCQIKSADHMQLQVNKNHQGVFRTTVSTATQQQNPRRMCTCPSPQVIPHSAVLAGIHHLHHQCYFQIHQCYSRLPVKLSLCWAPWLTSQRAGIGETARTTFTLWSPQTNTSQATTCIRLHPLPWKQVWMWCSHPRSVTAEIKLMTWNTPLQLLWKPLPQGKIPVMIRVAEQCLNLLAQSTFQIAELSFNHLRSLQIYLVGAKRVARSCQRHTHRQKLLHQRRTRQLVRESATIAKGLIQSKSCSWRSVLFLWKISGWLPWWRRENGCKLWTE